MFMIVSEFDYDEARAFYLMVWTAALQQLLGWSPAETREWASQWEDDMSGKRPWLYHESPMCHIAFCLLPAGFWSRHPEVDRVELELRIVDALEADTFPRPGGYVDRYDQCLWEAAKKRVQAILAESNETLPTRSL